MFNPYALLLASFHSALPQCCNSSSNNPTNKRLNTFIILRLLVSFLDQKNLVCFEMDMSNSCSAQAQARVNEVACYVDPLNFLDQTGTKVGWHIKFISLQLFLVAVNKTRFIRLCLVLWTSQYTYWGKLPSFPHVQGQHVSGTCAGSKSVKDLFYFDHIHNMHDIYNIQIQTNIQR